MEYGPEIKEQNGLLSETVSKIIPGQAVIGWFMTFLVAAEGLVMYFLSERYASFWGYGALRRGYPPTLYARV